MELQALIVNDPKLGFGSLVYPKVGILPCTSAVCFSFFCLKLLHLFSSVWQVLASMWQGSSPLTLGTTTVIHHLQHVIHIGEMIAKALVHCLWFTHVFPNKISLEYSIHEYSKIKIKMHILLFFCLAIVSYNFSQQACTMSGCSIILNSFKCLVIRSNLVSWKRWGRSVGRCL